MGGVRVARRCTGPSGPLPRDERVVQTGPLRPHHASTFEGSLIGDARKPLWGPSFAFIGTGHRQRRDRHHHAVCQVNPNPGESAKSDTLVVSMSQLGGVVSLGRLSARSLTAILCVALLAALLPVAALAAPAGKAREYIVTLSVVDSGRTIAPSSRSAKQRIRQRAVRADGVTDRLSRAHDFKTRYRYGNAITGFSAKLTPRQAAQVAADPSVAGVRPARTFKLASTERIAPGIKRIKAWTTGEFPGRTSTPTWRCSTRASVRPAATARPWAWTTSPRKQP